MALFAKMQFAQTAKKLKKHKKTAFFCISQRIVVPLRPQCGQGLYQRQLTYIAVIFYIRRLLTLVFDPLKPRKFQSTQEQVVVDVCGCSYTRRRIMEFSIIRLGGIYYTAWISALLIWLNWLSQGHKGQTSRNEIHVLYGYTSVEAIHWQALSAFSHTYSLCPNRRLLFRT